MSEIKVDTVAEKTSANGVTVDGLNIKDSKLVTSNSVVEANITDANITTDKIADDAVTADKLANSINTAIAANTAKTTNATHTGEVTGSGALTIADDVVDEANLKVSSSPSNGYFLSAHSGNTGGLTWAEAGGGGKILQVLSTTKTARQTTTSTSPVDISDMSISITPSASNSKILCTAFFGAVGFNGYQSFANLVRGSTDILLGDSAGSTQRCTIAFGGDAGNTTTSTGGFAVTFLDSPNTTSATTYKMQFFVRSGGTFEIGGTQNQTLSYFASAPSTFTVMEVGA